MARPRALRTTVAGGDSGGGCRAAGPPSIGSGNGARHAGAALPFGRTALALAAFCISSQAAAQYAEPEPPVPVERWYDAFDLGVFADAYASYNINRPAIRRDANRLRANDVATGFALSWAGIDAGYEPDPVGGHLSLRFGPTTSTLCSDLSPGDCRDETRIVTQAFASWRPGGRGGALTLDFGKFYSPYGAEVAESQHDFNYSRGLVYSLAQPRFFTGLRVTDRLADAWSLSALLVNGWDSSLDNNGGKSLGLLGQWSPAPDFAMKLGWLGGPELSAASAAWRRPRAWRHMVDWTLTYDVLETLSLSLDATWDHEGPSRHLDAGQRWLQGPGDWYGASLAARQTFTSMWALAARAEYLADPDGLSADPNAPTLLSGTLTLQVTPSDHLIVRWEHRGDFALEAEGSRRLFEGDGAHRRTYQLTSTLGVVVTSD
ncbi:MAG: porin [Polyangiaceae bacterium]|nr:porin [Polyangiaceae bacterium]